MPHVARGQVFSFIFRRNLYVNCSCTRYSLASGCVCLMNKIGLAKCTYSIHMSYVRLVSENSSSYKIYKSSVSPDFATPIIPLFFILRHDGMLSHLSYGFPIVYIYHILPIDGSTVLIYPRSSIETLIWKSVVIRRYYWCVCCLV
jgi:hypothetical protein